MTLYMLYNKIRIITISNSLYYKQLERGTLRILGTILASTMVIKKGVVYDS